MDNSKIIIIFIFFSFLTSCGVVKEGFKSPKQNKNDEFLVEKKSPLIMPPEFNDLPVPNSKNQMIKNEDKTIKNLIEISDENKNNKVKKNSSSLEGQILSEITK